MFKIISAKGLSLIEVLVSIVIMGIIVGGMFPFFVRIQQKQMLASNVSVLFQGALASFETRRLHTLSRNFNNDITGTFHTTTGVPTGDAGVPSASSPSRKIGTLYESMRSELGYYAMSSEEVMPFTVFHKANGPAIDWIYGRYITCNSIVDTPYTYRSDKSPVYSSDPERGYHRVFFFTSEMTCLVSLTKAEAISNLSGFATSNTSAVNTVVNATTTYGFGRYRNAFTFTGDKNITTDVFDGDSTVRAARTLLLKVADKFPDRRLFQIVTHHISGIYEWPDENTGHV